MAAKIRQYPSAFLTEWVLYVLDPYTGQYLEHNQLLRHSNLGTIWDSSFSNELGRLCQGAGKGLTSTGQRTKCTDTFNVIRFTNISRKRRKGITFTKAVYMFRPKK